MCLLFEFYIQLKLSVIVDGRLRRPGREEALIYTFFTCSRLLKQNLAFANPSMTIFCPGETEA